ncbi:hypothetical protein ACIPSE_10550 [Streptomyces sp. NPDC090106]|uniref:hypothetical protein n=1 Tax=Streptomyces sp. NPDC090106 TaxID=3365946 RepID=UPI00382B2291
MTSPARPATVRTSAAAGAATGLAPGALALGAQQLGGVVGMPGAAVRYVLLTTALLTLALTPLARKAAARVGAARLALAACLLIALAGAVPTVAVFCGAVVLCAPLGAAALALRTGPAWYPGALGGLATGAALTAGLPDRPELALLLCGAAGALLLAPAALTRATVRTAEPVRAVRGVRLTRAGLGFAVGAGAFAAQDFYTFRFSLVGAAPAGRIALAATGAALVWLGARAVLARAQDSTARGGAALFLAATCAALTAQSTATGPAQLTLALAALLACGTLTAVLLDAASPEERPDAGGWWTLLGALVGIGTVAGVGSALNVGDALTLCALPPLAGTVLLARTARRATVAAAAGPLLRVEDLTVRRRGRTEIRRLCLEAAPGEVLVLRDERAGQRAAALLGVLTGATRPARGGYRLHGEDVARTGPRARWLLGLSAALEPTAAADPALLPQLAADTTVREALRAAAARLGTDRADQAERAALAAFPAVWRRLDDPPRDLEPAERCVLGLAQTLLARPRLLLLDLTAPAAAALADDPQLADLIRRIAAQGTAVLVATAGSAAEPLGGRVLDLTERRPPRTRRARGGLLGRRGGPPGKTGGSAPLGASTERNPA